ncbi:MAG TPA: hypothetical protein VFQ65_33050, partial [Kofleriaceae bacterium]|nr:hypothetical protein [Kofleriaceae bacterium]
YDPLTIFRSHHANALDRTTARKPQLAVLVKIREVGTYNFHLTRLPMPIEHTASRATLVMMRDARDRTGPASSDGRHG